MRSYVTCVASHVTLCHVPPSSPHELLVITTVHRKIVTFISDDTDGLNLATMDAAFCRIIRVSSDDLVRTYLFIPLMTVVRTYIRTHVTRTILTQTHTQHMCTSEYTSQ